MKISRFLFAGYLFGLSSMVSADDLDTKQQVDNLKESINNNKSVKVGGELSEGAVARLLLSDITSKDVDGNLSLSIDSLRRFDSTIDLSPNEIDSASSILREYETERLEITNTRMQEICSLVNDDAVEMGIIGMLLQQLHTYELQLAANAFNHIFSSLPKDVQSTVLDLSDNISGNAKETTINFPGLLEEKPDIFRNIMKSRCQNLSGGLGIQID